MALVTSMPRIEEHRVTVQFDCPHCRSASRGTAYDLRETIRLSNRVPRWGWQSHWVRCAHCKAELHADCASEELVGASPTTVNEHVRFYLPFPRRVIAITSLILCWTPVVGVILGLVATGWNIRTRAWPRWVSVAALLMAVGLNIYIFTTVLVPDQSLAMPFPAVSAGE